MQLEVSLADRVFFSDRYILRNGRVAGSERRRERTIVMAQLLPMAQVPGCGTSLDKPPC